MHQISDHMALHASLTCQHPERKEICVRALRRIKYDALDADLSVGNIDHNIVDVNVSVKHYDDVLTRLWDKHAPLKKILFVDRPLND